MPQAERQPRILIVSQVYVPDPAAVGQYMAEAASALVQRGNEVTVVTSGRGYNDPSVKYPPRESLDGVDVVRLPWSSFGKRTMFLRLLGQGMFLLQVILRGLFMRRLKGMIVSTSPPMCSIAALVIRFLRRTPITFWVMDINPDQMVAMGRLDANALPVRIFDWLNRRILRASDHVVVLDRFMADRMNAKYNVQDKLSIIPPWPQQDHLELVQRSENPFIKQHNLQDKFVVMYSGNHGLTTPVDTLVEAALELQDDPRFQFLFVGEGLGKLCVEEAIEKHNSRNILSLPYQPLSEIKYSLSAADLHVVSLDERVVGIIHPCKVYGAMAVGRPLFSLGPSPSHVSDLLEKYKIGWQTAHGDVARAKQLLQEIIDTPAEELAAMGQGARQAVEQDLAKSKLCGEFCEVVAGAATELPYPKPEASHSTTAANVAHC